MHKNLRRADCWLMMLALFFSGSSFATTTFYVNANTFNSVDNTLDLPFQNDAGSITELNFDLFASGGLIDFAQAGAITIDLGLADPGATNVEVFAGSYGSGGGTFGTVSGNALLNRSEGVISNQMTFEFSAPVKGFGAWIFDDLGPASQETSFTMTAIEVGGASTTSTSLSAGNAGSFFVEGFMAVASDVGIEQVVITSSAPNNDFFEVDHIQIAEMISSPSTVSVPLSPWAMVLLSILLGVFGLMVLRKT